LAEMNFIDKMNIALEKSLHNEDANAINIKGWDAIVNFTNTHGQKEFNKRGHHGSRGDIIEMIIDDMFNQIQKVTQDKTEFGMRACKNELKKGLK
jgi:hypothetical protein